MYLVNALAIAGIDDEDEAVSVGKIVAPERTDLGLTSNVPDRKVDVLVCHGLYVESNGGDCVNDLAQLELVEDGRFASCVEAKHDDSDVLLPDEDVEER